MGTSIFLPRKINVGYQNRSDTYTGKLAYVIYFDEKGTLRKEASWNTWRTKELGNDVYDNVPTSGFVLNKKTGDYGTGWNHRQAKIRVHDPRGFEFEITPENLLFILENATSTKGKGLEGDFVYGWHGTDIVLVPVDSPDYKELTKLNDLRFSQDFVKAKDLKVGATYLSRDNVEFIYMGKFDEYDWCGVKKSKKSFFFYTKEGYLKTMQSISQKIISVISDECVENYSDLFEKLEGDTTFSPVDSSRDEYIPYTYEDFIVKLNGGRYWSGLYNKDKVAIEIYGTGDGMFSVRSRDRVVKQKRTFYGWDEYEYQTFVHSATLEEIFADQRPMWRKIYLANGRLYREEK
jgi:hypothetical protein